MDGEIIDAGARYFGFKTIRGSQNRVILDKGGVSSTIEMISALERGENVAVMVINRIIERIYDFLVKLLNNIQSDIINTKKSIETNIELL